MHCLAGYEKSHSANESGEAVLSFTASVALKKKKMLKKDLEWVDQSTIPATFVEYAQVITV